MRLEDRRPPFAGLANLTEQQLQSLPTPCYLLDEAQLRRNGQIMLELQQRTGCRALLAQKAFSNFDVYPVLAPYLAGTEASGLYESRLGREQLPEKENHVFCAAYRADEFAELLQYADHIVFNSPGQLAGGVEHDVVRVLQQLCELVCPVGGAEHMVLFFRQLLPAQAALVQAAGLGACQIRGQHRVHIKVGKGLLGQQSPASGALLQLQHDLTIPAQLGLVQQVAGGGQALQLLFRQVCQPCKGRAAILQPHQSTRAGLWLSLRGRPY